MSGMGRAIFVLDAHNGGEASAVTQVAEEEVGQILDAAVDKDDVKRSLSDAGLDGRAREDGSLSRSEGCDVALGLVVEKGVGLDGDDGRGKGREDDCGITCGGGEVENAVGRLDVGGLHKAREDEGREKESVLDEANGAVRIGGADEGGRDEEFAGNGCHSVKDTGVRHAVWAQLAVDHGAARGREVERGGFIHREDIRKDTRRL